MSITRGALRTRIAGRLGDVTQLVATANGTTTSFIDTIRLSGQIEGPGNRDIVFTSGDPIGQTRRITGYNLSSGTLNFSALGTGAPDEDDTAELYNFRGRGWRKDEYDNAINVAVGDAFPLFKIKVFADIVDEYDAQTGLIDIENLVSDSGLPVTHIYELDWQDQGGIWQPIESALTSRGQGWTVDQANEVIDVRGGYIPNGSVVRILGFAAHPLPVIDASLITIDPEWLTAHACEVLCMGATERDAANYNLGMVFGQIADKKRPAIRTRMPTGTVPVSI